MARLIDTPCFLFNMIAIGGKEVKAFLQKVRVKKDNARKCLAFGKKTTSTLLSVVFHGYTKQIKSLNARAKRAIPTLAFLQTIEEK